MEQQLALLSSLASDVEAMACLEAGASTPTRPPEPPPVVRHHPASSRRDAEARPDPVEEALYQMPAPKPLDETPMVSFVVPVSGPEYAARLENCLAAMRGQLGYPADCVGVVVALLIDRRALNLVPLEVVCMEFRATLAAARVDQGPFWLTKARNVGARHAQGDIYCFVDADVVLDPETLRRSVPYLTSERCSAVVLTSYMPKYASGHAVRYRGWKDAFSFRKDVREGTLHPEGYGGCLFVPKDAFLRLRGYDEAIRGWGAEDADMVKRLELAGYPVKNMTRHQSLRCMHQWHEDVLGTRMLAEQHRRYYQSLDTIERNPDGWGGAD